MRLANSICPDCGTELVAESDWGLFNNETLICIACNRSVDVCPHCNQQIVDWLCGCHSEVNETPPNAPQE